MFHIRVHRVDSDFELWYLSFNGSLDILTTYTHTPLKSCRSLVIVHLRCID